MTIIVQSIASASARDYDWLKASIAAWLHRTDLESIIPDFVMLAEKRIDGDLEARLADKTETLTTVPGDATVNLPADFMEMRSLSLTGHGPLIFASAQQLDDPANAQAGQPRYFTITGSAVRLGPVPAEVLTLNITYRGGVPALADNGGTNWLIEQNPDVYLAAAMCEAQMWARNDVELQKWELKYANAISKLDYDDWSSAGSLALANPS